MNYTPASLAREWGCSERHVRRLIDRKELRAFRLGGKLLRIKPEAVEEFECKRDTVLQANEGAESSSSTTEENATVSLLEPQTRAKLSVLRHRFTAS
jgi:excisionase family DNA binding protein